MITVYQLRWSHYVEKVRLALAYMRLPFSVVDIDAFRKDAFAGRVKPAHLPTFTVPAIHDARTSAFVMDSTPILHYLADTYPDAPKLFPGDAANRERIQRRLIEFDTTLALCARRFGYTQVILECPELLTELFLPHRSAVFRWPLVRSVTGHLLGMVLSKRFDFHRSDERGLYEALEQWLLTLAVELDQREFVVGAAFSAADIALAAQLRPLTIVPYFREHPRLQGLFARHEAVTASLGGERFAYERAIEQARLRRPPFRRRSLAGKGNLPTAGTSDLAVNDQRSVWDWGMFAMPWHYIVRLRRNRKRSAQASDGWR
ncbi:glutathione S-transferase family protein [Tahibacter amnicola]|uniref:Glutathione S-transferase family protein n=1 Tax=Tahibacter amnicola TaxID=2976241 RepID=A0ABY6BLB5_9GAMM|nr:glutathione S-transferase family protein [Tahibacter amnicola]UXI70267.1 glutathione S-transferase family protein [Tahibacter amnicola]